MNKSLHKHFAISLVLLIIAGGRVSAQEQSISFEALPNFDLEITELEYINQPVAEIIISLAQLGQLSILPEEGIAGNRSYYFRNISLGEALYQIIADNNLYMFQAGSIWKISPIRVDVAENGLVNIDADDVWIQDIFNALSRESFIPIQYSLLPSERTNIHMKNASVIEIVEILMLPFPEYRVEDNTSHIHIINTNSADYQRFASSAEISAFDNDTFSITGENIAVIDFLRDLFAYTDFDLLMFAQGNPLIQELKIQQRSFNEILQLITAVTGVYYREYLGVYAFFHRDIQQDDVIILEYTSKYYSPSELLNVLPPIQNCELKFFERSQSIIVQGRLDYCSEIIELLNQIDTNEGNGIWPFTTAYINFSDITRILPSKFTHRILQSDNREGYYYAVMSYWEYKELEILLGKIDIPQESYSYTLNNIPVEELQNYLPPDFPSWRVRTNENSSLVHIVGQKQLFDRFQEIIEPIDKSPTQIQYQILIIQYQKSSGAEFGSEVNIAPLNADSTEGISAGLSNILRLNFDIVSTFGYGFANELSLDISSARARVVADTLLRAESGKQVRFENTSTFRYRERNDSEDRTNTVIRELTTGLEIEIDGSINNSDIINMDLTIQLSRQGTDVSRSGNPPPSTNRQIETSVKTPSGEATRIAGIALWEDSDFNTGFFPIGSFGSSREISEFVIHILPYSSSVEKFEHLPKPEIIYQEVLGYE